MPKVNRYYVNYLLLDKATGSGYNDRNCIGQFETILSVNKTREFGVGALRPFFVLRMGLAIRIFYL